ncbi:MAG: ribonuclease PH [Bradymonadaceae bacterium]
MREDGRTRDEIRPVTIETGYTSVPDGSVRIQTGDTMVLCTASASDWLPRWRKKQAGPDEEPDGWVTAQYAMLPGSTSPRSRRPVMRGKMSGRTHEIKRLIARSLRGVVDLEALGPRSIQLDCEVLQADGGTRTASITGAWVAMAIAAAKLYREDEVETFPVHETLAAISAGVVDGETLLDLPYEEDSAADVDMNVVMNGAGEYVEVQGTGEEATYSRRELDELLDLAEKGIGELTELQRQALPGDSIFEQLFD